MLHVFVQARPLAAKEAHMHILVKLSTTLRDCVPGYDPESGLRMEVPEGESVAGMVRRLGLPPEEIKIIMVNGRQYGADRTLRDGDRLALFPAVGGG